MTTKPLRFTDLKLNGIYVDNTLNCSTEQLPLFQPNMGDKPVIISDFFSKIFKKLPAQSEFLPKICQHVTNEIVYFETGHYGFVIKMEGLAFDGVDDKHLFSSFVGLKDLFSAIGKTFGNRAAVWTTLRRSKIEFNQQYDFQSAFCQQFANHYLERFKNEDYFENTFFLTLIIKNNSMDVGIKECQEQIQILLRALETYSPTVLTA